jgi:hypothetical protein
MQSNKDHAVLLRRLGSKRKCKAEGYHAACAVCRCFLLPACETDGKEQAVQGTYKRRPGHRVLRHRLVLPEHSGNCKSDEILWENLIPFEHNVLIMLLTSIIGDTRLSKDRIVRRNEIMTCGGIVYSTI